MDEQRADANGNGYDLICLSHLRWDSVFQRPQHLMTRFARERRVYFIEEPIVSDGVPDGMACRGNAGVRVVTPRMTAPDDGRMRALLDRFLSDEGVRDYALWYYTPMALSFTEHLSPCAVVYDCMDELANFKGAPSDLTLREADLFRRADVVFTGGQSLYRAKRGFHPNTHAFPSSIDATHFSRAKRAPAEPEDQRTIPRPRLGFYGVIDERMDLGLVGGVAAGRPDWQIVLIGPVAKIDPACLPRLPNIHYLGQKSYAELPAYLAGWDVAMLPFALNDSTRFISPTKTPEYLAAGRPVVSTPIADVVDPYGRLGLVHIAQNVNMFVAAAERAMSQSYDRAWRESVDAFLAGMSWDATLQRMQSLIASAIASGSVGACTTI